MCKTCGFAAHISCSTSSITVRFYTALLLNFNELRTSAFYTRIYNLVYTLFLNNLFSYFLSVNRKFSTVSTVPTIRIAKIKFKFVYNN